MSIDLEDSNLKRLLKNFISDPDKIIFVQGLYKAAVYDRNAYALAG